MLRLKEILKKKGINQLILAKAIRKSSVTISHWATGKATPSLKSLIKICNFLEVDLSEIVNSEKRAN